MSLTNDAYYVTFDDLEGRYAGFCIYAKDPLFKARVYMNGFELGKRLIFKNRVSGQK